jgi:hypothetical protein
VLNNCNDWFLNKNLSHFDIIDHRWSLLPELMLQLQLIGSNHFVFEVMLYLKKGMKARTVIRFSFKTKNSIAAAATAAAAVSTVVAAVKSVL